MQAQQQPKKLPPC